MSEIKKYRCNMCRGDNPRIFQVFDRKAVIIHHLDDHRGNLMFLSDADLKMMITEVEP
ncbi:MAG: hypothetical protein IH840_00125 [Candidatus Heimdallarchaeota archaeon]|nr:hypothetical protein [Candidatus Heimdallarchaeota archaeon]